MRTIAAYILAILGFGVCAGATGLAAYLILLDKLPAVFPVWALGMLIGAQLIVWAEHLSDDREVAP